MAFYGAGRGDRSVERWCDMGMVLGRFGWSLCQSRVICERMSGKGVEGGQRSHVGGGCVLFDGKMVLAFYENLGAVGVGSTTALDRRSKSR